VLTLTTLEQWRDFATTQRTAGARIGLIPTMGALHDGHSALIRAAVENGDVALVTSFVNPLQFTNGADLAAYPMTPDDDAARAARDGAAALVTPSVAAMWPNYPNETPTVVHVRGVSERFEGEHRPGHFDGVATVVTKLFSITGPCRAYFGEKDYQQVAVVRQLVRDLGLDVTIVVVPTVRDDHGLALSSRNRRLSPAGLEQAQSLSAGLRTAAVLAKLGRPASVLRGAMRELMEAAGVVVSYAEVVDPDTLLPFTDDARGAARALVAGEVEGVRLIDNFALEIGAAHAAGH